MKLHIVVTVTILFCLIPTYQPSCVLPLHGEWEKFSPLAFQNNSVIEPEGGSIRLRKGENITLICPDNKNYITSTNANVSYAICEQGSTLRLINKKVSYETIQCKKTIRGEVRKTALQCAKRKGRIYEIGHRFPKNKFISLIKVCYHNSSGNVFYTQHSVHGLTVNDSSGSNYRPSFSTEGLGPNIPAAVAYKRAYQKSTFSSLLRSSKLAERYINDKSFLARGHLSPDADFLLAAYQYTSYYYINTSPQWQIVNAGNWKKLEFMTRKHAAVSGNKLMVITGNYGILKLPDVNRELVDIYLAPGDKLPVPEQVWKIIYSMKNRKAVVLVVVNNPFVDRAKDLNFLCVDICQESGWDADSWTDIRKGYVYCCEYSDFLRSVPTAPQLDVNGILKY